MSIIQDALKKVQKKEEKSTFPSVEKLDFDRAFGGQIKLKNIEVPAQKTPKVYLLLLLISVLILALTIFVLIDIERQNTKKYIPGYAKQEAPSKQEVVHKPLPPKESPAPAMISGYAPFSSTSVFLKTEAKNVPKFLLNGVMYLEGGPQAIVNNAVVKEGDVVEGARVVKINRNDVIMRFKDEEITLRLI